MHPVTVVIPTYNRAHLLPRAVRSALAAMEPDDELIVVDDGSTDDTAAVLGQFGDSIRYLRTPNDGPGAARNHGIRAARHALIAFLDSDAEWMPDMLRLARPVMAARDDIVMTFGDFALRDAAGRDHPRYLDRWNEGGERWGDALYTSVRYSSIARPPQGRPDLEVFIGDGYGPMCGGSAIPVSTALVRRTVNGRTHEFPTDLPAGVEWEYFARVARHGQVAFLDCELARSHGHPRALASTRAGAWSLYTSRIRVAERVWGGDPEFLADYGFRYRSVVERAYLTRARWLLGKGRMQEARADLDASGAGAVLLRTLAWMPAPVGKAAGLIERAALGAAYRKS